MKTCKHLREEHGDENLVCKRCMPKSKRCNDLGQMPTPTAASK